MAFTRATTRPASRSPYSPTRHQPAFTCHLSPRVRFHAATLHIRNRAAYPYSAQAQGAHTDSNSIDTHTTGTQVDTQIHGHTQKHSSSSNNSNDNNTNTTAGRESTNRALSWVLACQPHPQLFIPSNKFHHISLYPFPRSPPPPPPHRLPSHAPPSLPSAAERAASSRSARVPPSVAPPNLRYTPPSRVVRVGNPLGEEGGVGGVDSSPFAGGGCGRVLSGPVCAEGSRTRAW